MHLAIHPLLNQIAYSRAQLLLEEYWNSGKIQSIPDQVPRLKVRRCWEPLDLALLLKCLHQGHGPSQPPSQNNWLGLRYIEFIKYLVNFHFKMSFVTTWLQLSIPTEEIYKLRSQTLEMHLFTLQLLISGHHLGTLLIHSSLLSQPSERKIEWEGRKGRKEGRERAGEGEREGGREERWKKEKDNNINHLIFE